MKYWAWGLGFGVLGLRFLACSVHSCGISHEKVVCLYRNGPIFITPLKRVVSRGF